MINMECRILGGTCRNDPHCDRDTPVGGVCLSHFCMYVTNENTNADTDGNTTGDIIGVDVDSKPSPSSFLSSSSASSSYSSFVVQEDERADMKSEEDVHGHCELDGCAIYEQLGCNSNSKCTFLSDIKVCRSTPFSDSLPGEEVWEVLGGAVEVIAGVTVFGTGYVTIHAPNTNPPDFIESDGLDQPERTRKVDVDGDIVGLDVVEDEDTLEVEWESSDSSLDHDSDELDDLEEDGKEDRRGGFGEEKAATAKAERKKAMKEEKRKKREKKKRQKRSLWYRVKEAMIDTVKNYARSLFSCIGSGAGKLGEKVFK